MPWPRTRENTPGRSLSQRTAYSGLRGDTADRGGAQSRGGAPLRALWLCPCLDRASRLEVRRSLCGCTPYDMGHDRQRCRTTYRRRRSHLRSAAASGSSAVLACGDLPAPAGTKNMILLGLSIATVLFVLSVLHVFWAA